MTSPRRSSPAIALDALEPLAPAGVPAFSPDDPAAIAQLERTIEIFAHLLRSCAV